MAGARVYDDEKKSYSAIFLLAVGMLLVGAIWAVWDDNITRRPWKEYQAEFFAMEVQRAKDELQQERERLTADAKYQEVQKQLAEARASVATGEGAQRLAELARRRVAIVVRVEEEDFNLRLVKSKLEEAWYEYEHATLTGAPTDKAKAHIEELDREKAAVDAAGAEVQKQQEQIDKEVAELHSKVKSLEDELAQLEAPRIAIERRLEGLEIHPFGLSLPRIPKIQQVVLPEFDRNAFYDLVARVDRCTSCHAGIEKAGFEKAPNPFKTHPDKKGILGKHAPERFGCTPCHGGQGPAVNSVQKAHGEVKFWEHELLRGHDVEANCIRCHADVKVPHAETIARGEELFVRLGCHGCHLVEGYDGIERVGPYLRRIAAKANPEWLIRWVENPHKIRPRTKMPNFMFDREQATAIAAYLLDASRADSEAWLADHAPPAAVDPRNADRVAAGKALADSLGCRGCHGFADGESPALLGANKDIAPNLSNVAEKTDGRWIYHWIKNPRGYSPVARMPSLRLSDDEAGALTSYLLTLGTKPTGGSPDGALHDPQVIADGKALVRKYGCFACHDVAGMETESRIGVELSTFASKPKEELFFGNRTDIPETWGDWTSHKLKEPRTYATERIEQVMPQFDLADEDIDALRVFLLSRTEEKVPAKYRYPTTDRVTALVQGRRVVEKYNCVGCHVIAGEGGAIRARYEEAPTLAPPVLNGEGAKVQPEWFYGFLKKPIPIRPWLKVRMPTFGMSDEEAKQLVDYFMAQNELNNPFVYINQAAIPGEHVEAGKLLASPDYFNCFSCHQQGDKKPEGPEEGWAPDLAMARERLNPNWIIRWLEDPQKVQPGTKMPSFYPGGPEDVFDGDEARQIQALRDYLLTLGTGGLRVASRDGGPTE